MELSEEASCVELNKEASCVELRKQASSVELKIQESCVELTKDVSCVEPDKNSLCGSLNLVSKTKNQLRRSRKLVRREMSKQAETVSKRDGLRSSRHAREESVPGHREESDEEPTAHGLDPTAGEFRPSLGDERYLTTIMGALESVLKADLDTRLRESTTAFTEALDAMEERNASVIKATENSAKERDSVLSELLKQLVLSNMNATEQASRAERDRLDFERRQRAEHRERYEEEKEERSKREALKAIPAPPPMSKDQDIADYLELFETNMECRQIPKAARASHLIPLLNSKSLVAISGLPPEAKLDMAVLKKTLLATANTSTRYASKAYWDFTKKSGDSFLAMGTQMMKLARRFATAGTADEVMEKFTIENMLQKMPAEMQQYCREKEPVSIENLANMAGKYFALKGLDELKMDANKPWTLKPREDKVEEKKHNWHGKRKPFKQWDTRQIHDSSTPQADDQKHIASQQPKEGVKEDDKPFVGSKSNSFLARKKCYFCGDYGHFSRNCPKRKQVNVAHVPSLCKVKDSALTIPGRIGHTQVPDMLCDSGATISVIASHLVPPETKLQEEVWIETLDGPAKPYPTALVETEVNNKTIELFAAVLPAEATPYPVILGRYIPGMTVTWSMTVGNDKETVFQLEQDTCSGETAPLAKKSTRRKKFKQMLDTAVPKEDAVAGEPTSQVVEERADTVPSAVLVQPHHGPRNPPERKSSSRSWTHSCYQRRMQWRENTPAKWWRRELKLLLSAVPVKQWPRNLPERKSSRRMGYLRRKQ